MQPQTRTLRMIALLGALLLIGAACGGGDEGGGEETTTTAAATTTTEAAEETTTTEAEETTTTEGTPSEVTVTTYFGGEVTVPYQPQTVVVLDYAALDTLDYLGLGDLVVGIPSGTTVPPHLASYAESAENVGDLFEPDFEAINALAPDLIVAGGRSQALVPELSEIAPTVDMTFEWGSEPFVDSLTLNTMAIGQIFGVEAETASALEALNASAMSVAEQAADEGTGLVIMTSGGEVSAYGPDPLGRFDMVYNVLGITPAAEQVAIDTHGDAISFEFLAETNPDMLIVLDRDAAIGEEGASAQEILDNDLVNGTNAVVNDKVVYVDTAKWYLAFGGLSAVETMVSEVDSLVD